MNTSEAPLMDFFGLVAICLSIIVLLLIWSAPWILVVFFTKRRRMWLWWYRNGWKGTALIASLATLARLPLILGTFLTDHIEWSLILFVPEVYPVSLLSEGVNRLLPNLSEEGRAFQHLFLEWVVLFGLFTLLKASKTYFAKKAYEIEG